MNTLRKCTCTQIPVCIRMGESPHSPHVYVSIGCGGCRVGKLLIHMWAFPWRISLPWDWVPLIVHWINDMIPFHFQTDTAWNVGYTHVHTCTWRGAWVSYLAPSAGHASRGVNFVIEKVLYNPLCYQSHTWNHHRSAIHSSSCCIKQCD